MNSVDIADLIVLAIISAIVMRLYKPQADARRAIKQTADSLRKAGVLRG